MIQSKEFIVRALVRDPTKAKVFKEQFGVEAIVGSHSDKALLEREAETADFVITTVRSLTVAFSPNAEVEALMIIVGRRR